MSNFKKAARLKLRFPSVKGFLSVEQLYDLPLTSKAGFDLDSVAKTINASLRVASEDSFVNTKPNLEKDLNQLCLDIVKEVIADRIAENEANAKAVANRHEREKLLTVLEGKKDAALANLTEAELEERIRALS